MSATEQFWHFLRDVEKRRQLLRERDALVAQSQALRSGAALTREESRRLLARAQAIRDQSPIRRDGGASARRRSPR